MASERQIREPFRRVSDKLSRVLAEEKLSSGTDYEFTGVLDGESYRISIVVKPKKAFAPHEKT